MIRIINKNKNSVEMVCTHMDEKVSLKRKGSNKCGLTNNHWIYL